MVREFYYGTVRTPSYWGVHDGVVNSADVTKSR